MGLSVQNNDTAKAPADVPFLLRGPGVAILGRCLLCNVTKSGRKAKPGRGVRPTWICFDCKPRLVEVAA